MMPKNKVCPRPTGCPQKKPLSENNKNCEKMILPIIKHIFDILLSSSLIPILKKIRIENIINVFQ